MMLIFASCEKESNIDSASTIVGWWEMTEWIENDYHDNFENGYYSVIEFTSNGVYGFYDNSDYEIGESPNESYISKNLGQFQFGTYWIDGNHLYDKYGKAESLLDCGEFGNPGCECNQDGYKHLTSIVEMTETKMILKLEYDDYGDVVEIVFKKISKPKFIENYQNGYWDLVNSRQ